MGNQMDKGQKSAIESGQGPILVLAGPGSGKTTVITHRIKYLINEVKVQPNRILVVTFTNAAANEMKERTIALCGDIANKVEFGTFHAISLMILREEKGITDGDIMLESERRNIVKELCAKHFPNQEDKKRFLKDALNELSLAQSYKGGVEKFNPHICDKNKFIQFFNEYILCIRKTGRLTFDDMLYDCVELLEKNEDFKKKWQSKWEYILVDEYQDSNPIQEQELEILSYPQNNIMVVGDDDQSIYGFRGADPKVMLDFPKHFSNTNTIHLSTNYRSTEEIVLVSNILIKNNKERYEKNPISFRKKGKDVVIKRESNIDFQNKFIVENIQKLYNEGIPYREMSIICRTNRETGVFVETLLKNQIPFTTKEVVENIYDHWVAKDIMAYLQIAIDGNNETLLKRIINKPKRYIEKDIITKTRPFSIENVREIYDKQYKNYICDALDKLSIDIEKIRYIIENQNTYDALTYILDNVGYKKYLESYALETQNSLNELCSVVDELLNSASKYIKIKDWFSYIQQYSEQIKNKSFNEKEDAISIVTMHGAKGLEYQVVFVPNLIEGQVPYMKAKTPMEIEEERRMFYVAITRAKTYLYLITPRMFNGKETNQSRFVKEITRGLEKIQLEKARQMILSSSAKQKETKSLIEIDEIEQNKKKEKIVIPKDIKKDTLIKHNHFGIGYLQERNENDKKLKIYFENFGKTFVLDETFCLENNLLSFPQDKKGVKNVKND